MRIKSDSFFWGNHMILEILTSGQKIITYEHCGLHGIRGNLWKACLL